jgi:hypothetical protein
MKYTVEMARGLHLHVEEDTVPGGSGERPGAAQLGEVDPVDLRDLELPPLDGACRGRAGSGLAFGADVFRIQLGSPSHSSPLSRFSVAGTGERDAASPRRALTGVLREARSLDAERRRRVADLVAEAHERRHGRGVGLPAAKLREPIAARSHNWLIPPLPRTPTHQRTAGAASLDSVVSDHGIPQAHEAPPSASAQVVALPRVGGLHHRCRWSEAARARDSDG